MGPFLLVEQLGRGGFAPVWLARETYGAKEVRRAAVKLFAIGGGRGADRDAVAEEAGALCRVEHPNVVRFYQLAIDEAAGVAGLAMEYVHGTQLDRRLEDGPLSIDEALDVGVAVASALAAVHAAGLVHRDVKPANVVEAGGVHKLIDFGIAAAEDRADRAKAEERPVKRVVLDDLPLEVLGTKMSMLLDDAGSSSGGTGPIVSSGTVGYMDPATVGEGAAPSPASDLYALGALLYEALSGKLPAVAAADGGAGMRGEVLDGRIAPPPLAEVAPAVPADLAAIVDSLLRPRREDRPASAREVAASLQAARRSLAGDAAAEPAKTTVVAAPAASAPRRSGAALRIGVGALALGALVLALSGRLRGDPPAAAPPAAAPSSCAFGDAAGCNARCEAGDAASCQTLGAMLESGTGAPKDESRAGVLYRKACDAGRAGACTAAGIQAENARGRTKDDAAARAFYRRACDAGDAQGCNLLGVLTADGRGGEADPRAALVLYERACEAGFANGCSNQGVLFEHGEGVAKDEARAAGLYRRACDDGSASACAMLGILYAAGRGVAQDPAKAASLYEKGCDAGHAFACAGLGVLYELGTGVAKDMVRAASLYQRACDKKDGVGCSNLGRAYDAGAGVEKDPKRAVYFYQRACDEMAGTHDGSGCRLLAAHYAAGDAVEKDEARARTLYEKACTAGDADACAAAVGDKSRTLAAGSGRIATPAAQSMPAGPRSHTTCNCSPGDPLCTCF